jgi:hypothetical protein
MNRCYICQAEAVARCYTCGQLMCAQHGRENCQRCDTGVVAGDPRPTQVAAPALGPADTRHGWWRPQPAEEFEPPACYACKALARAVCRHCQSHYCRDHAGRAALCADCTRSARLGVIVFVLVIALLVAIVLFGNLVTW